MPKTLDPNQLQKIDGRYLQPIYFCHFSFLWQYKGTDPAQSSAACSGNKIIQNQYTGDHWLTAGIQPGDLFKFDNTGSWIAVDTIDNDLQVTLVSNGPYWEGGPYTFKREGTLYVSDRNFYYNGHNYEDYLFDLSGIEDQIANLGGYDNAQVTLHFKNEPFRDRNYLIEFLDTVIEGRYVEIYRLLVNTGETFGSDVSAKIFKGEMGQPYKIDDIEFFVNCSKMLFGKNAKLPLDVIDLYDFPGADPDDVGKPRSIPIGSIKKLVCLWTVAGWVSTLTADITINQNAVNVSDATNAPSTPFSIMCDNEEIRVTSKTGNDFTCTRGYGGTPSAHSKGSIVYEKRSNFTAEVAQCAVKSIGDIFALRSGNWVRILSGFTKYLTAPACIVFTDKCKFEEKVQITATTEPYEGTHIHAIPAGGFSSKQCVPDGSSGATGHENVIDGNTASYCGIAQDEGVQARFDGEANLGTVARQQIWIYKNDTGASGYVQCPINVNLQIMPGAGTSGWFRVIKTGGNWTDSVVVMGGSGGNQIGEIYKIVEYTPVASEATTHPATGIDVAVTLTGNSVANMFIGDVVACDVEGYADPDGNYGGIGTLIERPDWVRKLILVGLLGFSSSDIGASFATVGTTYGSRISGGYKLAFNLPDVARETMDLFKKIDFETRSNMFESGGLFQLAFNSLSDPTSQITFDKHNIEGRFLFSNTEIADIKNKLRAHYFRDYSKSGSIGEKYQKVKEAPDAISIAKYGEIFEDLEFMCIGDLTTMVTDVLAWILHEKKDIKKIVEFNALWDADILENCDYFTVTSNFFSGYKWKTLKLRPKIRGQIIEIKGLKYEA